MYPGKETRYLLIIQGDSKRWTQFHRSIYIANAIYRLTKLSPSFWITLYYTAVTYTTTYWKHGKTIAVYPEKHTKSMGKMQYLGLFARRRAKLRLATSFCPHVLGRVFVERHQFQAFTVRSYSQPILFPARRTVHTHRRFKITLPNIHQAHEKYLSSTALYSLMMDRTRSETCWSDF